MRTLELYSIGSACVRLGQPFGTVTRALAELGIKPHMKIDGVDHYTLSDVCAASQQIVGRWSACVVDANSPPELEPRYADHMNAGPLPADGSRVRPAKRQPQVTGRPYGVGGMGPSGPAGPMRV